MKLKKLLSYFVRVYPGDPENTKVEFLHDASGQGTWTEQFDAKSIVFNTEHNTWTIWLTRRK